MFKMMLRKFFRRIWPGEQEKSVPGTIILFGLNILLMLTSWVFYRFLHADEYLILFMIPLVFIGVAFILTIPMTIVLFLCNLAFFIFYDIIGILDTVDVLIYIFLLGAVASGSYLIKFLYMSFVLYYKSDTLRRQHKYDHLVNELEAMDRRGRKTENELSRISRLYEITKKLAPALKFDDLLTALFYFLEENFSFQTIHLLMFREGKFFRGISKGIGDEESPEDYVRDLDCEKVIAYLRERDLEPFFIERKEEENLFNSIKIESDSFMVFPLFTEKKLCAILAVEGASMVSYSRFRILVSQIALEFRKVELYERVQKLSIIDGLTEVYLRRYLMDRLGEEVDRSGRLGLSFSIAMIDVDRFKECNDKYGHLMGDAVLRKVADRLKSSVREVDMIARYGGEEFCIVLPETTKELALSVAERLRKSIGDEEIRAFDKEVKVTISGGLATYPEDGKNVEVLIEKADAALYKSKRQGRNIISAA